MVVHFLLLESVTNLIKERTIYWQLLDLGAFLVQGLDGVVQPSKTNIFLEGALNTFSFEIVFRLFFKL